MVNNMENAEEVMQILDRFTRLKQKEIPKELDEYLQYVAKTGDTVFKWSSLKYLFREKLLNVIKHFHDTTPRVDEIPQYPNVDPFNYESMKSSLLERLELFNAAPFTIQRLCELLIDPRKQYSRIDKFMRALEKNILVSTIEPGRKRTESENGDSLDSVVNGDLSLDVNVDIDMENESIFQMEAQNGNGTAATVAPLTAAAAGAAASPVTTNAAETSAATTATNNTATTTADTGEADAKEKSTSSHRAADDDILPNPKKAKLDLSEKDAAAVESLLEEIKDKSNVKAVSGDDDDEEMTSKLDEDAETKTTIDKEEEEEILAATKSISDEKQMDTDVLKDDDDDDTAAANGEKPQEEAVKKKKKEEEEEENDEKQLVQEVEEKQKEEKSNAKDATEKKTTDINSEKTVEKMDETENNIESETKTEKVDVAPKAEKEKEQKDEEEAMEKNKCDRVEKDAVASSTVAESKVSTEVVDGNKIATEIKSTDDNQTKTKNEKSEQHIEEEKIIEKQEIEKCEKDENAVAMLDAEKKKSLDITTSVSEEITSESTKTEKTDVSDDAAKKQTSADDKLMTANDDKIEIAVATVTTTVAAAAAAAATSLENSTKAVPEEIASPTKAANIPQDTNEAAATNVTANGDNATADTADEANDAAASPDCGQGISSSTSANTICDEKTEGDNKTNAIELKVKDTATDVTPSATVAVTPIEADSPPLAVTAASASASASATVTTATAAAPIEEDPPVVAVTAAPTAVAETATEENTAVSSTVAAVADTATATAVAAAAAAEAVATLAPPSLTLNDQPMEDALTLEEVPPVVEEVVMAESTSGGAVEMATDAIEPTKDEPAGMEVDDTSQEAMDQ